jgi:hypothetical protein
LCSVLVLFWPLSFLRLSLIEASRVEVGRIGLRAWVSFGGNGELKVDSRAMGEEPFVHHGERSGVIPGARRPGDSWILGPEGTAGSWGPGR